MVGNCCALMFLFSRKRRLENEQIQRSFESQSRKKNRSYSEMILEPFIIDSKLGNPCVIFGCDLNFLPYSFLIFSTTSSCDSACVSKLCNRNHLRQLAPRQTAVVQLLTTYDHFVSHQRLTSL